MDATLMEPESDKIRNWDNWSKWVLFMMVGLALTGRSFAYIGVPPAKLFIGDFTLAAFIFLRPRQLFDTWIRALTKGGPLGPIAWILLISVSYGIFEVVRGVLLGFGPITAIQNLVFNVYPLYLFLGIWVGARRPQLLLRYIHIFAICFCFYAPAFFFFLHKVQISMPGTDDIALFGQADNGGFIILGLLCLDPKPGRYWFAMIIAAFGLLAVQVRAEWIGMILALTIWGVLTRKMTRVFGVFAAIALLLFVGAVAEVRIPSPEGRGGAVSSSEIVARAIAAVSPDLARDITGSGNTSFYRGTVTWRENWWKAIWANSQENYTNLLIGPGYGFLLRDLVNYLKGSGDVRTPHNVFFYALGYSGWIGVVLFFTLQAACGALLWRAFKLSGQAYGIAAWASLLLAAFFGNMMETPFGAIPFYLTVGLAVGPTLTMKSAPASSGLQPAAAPVLYAAPYTSDGI